MPRFFFDFCQAGDCSADTVGIELANVEEAYLEVAGPPRRCGASF